MALGSTRLLTDMNARNLPGGKGRAAGAYSWQPHRHLLADCLENVGASTSHNLMGLHGLLQGYLYLFFFLPLFLLSFYSFFSLLSLAVLSPKQIFSCKSRNIPRRYELIFPFHSYLISKKMIYNDLSILSILRIIFISNLSRSQLDFSPQLFYSSSLSVPALMSSPLTTVTSSENISPFIFTTALLAST
jgi:hypothetical protein